MNLKHHDETESRLTAYAFGELEGAERVAMDAAVADDPLLAMRVAELRAFADELGAALADEPAPTEYDDVPVFGLSPGPGQASPGPAGGAPRARGRMLRFPASAWAAAGMAAAAAIAVMFWANKTERTADPRGAGEVVVVRPPSETGDDTLRSTPAPLPTPAPGLAGPYAMRNPEEPPAPTQKAGPIPPMENDPADKLGVPGPIENPPTTDLAATVPEPAPAAPGAPAPLDIPVLVASSPSRATPGDVRAMLDRGRGLYAAGDLAEAIATFETVHKLDARNREAIYFTARIAQEKARALGGGRVRWDGRRPVAQGQPNLAPIVAPRRASSPVRPRAGPVTPLEEAFFVSAKSTPVSTFGADVDTASYPAVRRMVRNSRGRMSPPFGMDLQQVRIEELINYFPYRYAPPEAPAGIDPEEPFAAHLAVASAPWAPDHRLVRVAIKAVDLAPEDRPPANLVFVVDLSGSMGAFGGLDLVKVALAQLVERLRPDDRVAIVGFAGKSGLVLRSTPVERRDVILSAIGRLSPGGGTNGESGIEQGYAIAQEHFAPEKVNRVVFCTDGGFNMGATERARLIELIREKARGRVFLTVLGFGMSTPDGDERLEALADNGDGVYGFVDSVAEARKLLLDEIGGTLSTVAKDVKIQVEFNPDLVSSYRLIGYENRALDRARFKDEATDAGEIGVGHSLTALYEVDPARGRVRKRVFASAAEKEAAERLLTLRIRYKTPRDEKTRSQEFTVADEGRDFEDADEDFRFAASVAAWGMLLRGSSYSGGATFESVLDWAGKCRSYDPGGYRTEFLELVKDSRRLIDPR